MATLDILAGPSGPLTSVTVRLRPGRMPERLFYATQEFMESVQNKLPTWTTGNLKASQTPAEQLDDILNRWNAGRPLKYGRQFQDLMPAEDEIWEMKTTDLRIFGWLYRPKVFIAGRLGYADWYKGRAPVRSYETDRQAIIKIRDELDLDSPKFATGVYDALV